MGDGKINGIPVFQKEEGNGTVDIVGDFLPENNLEQKRFIQVEPEIILKITHYLKIIYEENVDFTETYDEWIKMGFAFASLGEIGRIFYHQLSNINKGYDYKACNSKFDNLLANKREGGKVEYFFKVCKERFGDWKNIKDEFEKLLEVRELILDASTKVISFLSPILLKNGNGLIFPNTINLVQGKFGTHKSRLTESIVSTFLSEQNNEESLGFKVNRELPYSVLIVDTERNLGDQLPYAIQRVKANAGIDIKSKPSNLDCISLIKINRANRFNILKKYLERIRKETANHFIIVLDVITDCIGNFNDPAESLKIIDFLNELINDYNVTFLCIVHENPTKNEKGEKARGHIGTELANKASTIFQIQFDDKQTEEILKINILKLRQGKRPDPFYVRYCEERKGLILLEDFIGKEPEIAKAEIDDLKEFLVERINFPITKGCLKEEVTSFFRCSETTFERRLCTLLKHTEQIQKKTGEIYYLSKRKSGRETEYFLST